MDRRSFLAAACLTVSGIVAGCASDDSADPECHLTHEVVESTENYGDVVATYRYEDLDSDARRVVEAAVANGSFSTANETLEPTAFRYSDTVAVYRVTYQNTTHVLLTYTSGGCERQ